MINTVPVYVQSNEVLASSWCIRQELFSAVKQCSYIRFQILTMSGFVYAPTSQTGISHSV